jgi:hypothetical protein
MAILTLNGVVIRLPEGFFLPADSQPDGQRLMYNLTGMLSIRHNEGFDSLSNNLGRIPNLARAGLEQIHYILFYFLLLAG